MTQSTSSHQATARTSAATDIALITTFAALIAVSALLPSIAVAGLAVPITVQTLAINLTGCLLGARRGFLAVILYIAVGIAGAPIFSQGRNGLTILASPSVGYVIAFPILALLSGYLANKFAKKIQAPFLRASGIFFSCALPGLLVVFPLGALGMAYKLNLTLGEAFTSAATFIPGDLVKCAIAAVITLAVWKAYPNLSDK